MRHPLAVAVVAALVAALAPHAFAMKDEHFQGKPARFEAGKLNAGLWQDEAGQHVRFSTGGEAEHKFTGKVCAEKVTKVDGFELEASDKVSIDPEGHCLVFAFTTDGAVDGFDFQVEGLGVTFDLQLDGQPLPKKAIFIGKESVHPKQQQFVLNRS